MRVEEEKCIACGDCIWDCPLGAISIKQKVAVIDQALCADCGVCRRVCEQEAIVSESKIPAEALVCDACPIGCWIKKGFWGACKRFQNVDGQLIRVTPLHTYEDVREIVGRDHEEAIGAPLVTGIGSGTTYPDCKPAPQIVYGQQHGVDVVTVVTEGPLSYSSILVKIDTDHPIGREGDPVMVGKRVVGMVETEQYGSKMLHIGGVNRLTGPNGFVVARTITDIANRKPVKLKVGDENRLRIQVGQPPSINNQEADKMRVGCGSATLGIFAPLLQQAADEAVVLDSHITGLLSRHAAGRYAGAQPTGVSLVFEESTPGRYFGDHGNGWGGTSIETPEAAIASVDMNIGWPGMTILVTETTGQNAAMFECDASGNLQAMPLSHKAVEATRSIGETCESSSVSALYMGGAGGSARAGVTKYPVKLTQEVHARRAHLSIGGAPAFVLPGGGITFMVDVQRVKADFCSWTPTPATICPIEYTMRLEDYRKIGGHVEAMKPFDALEPGQSGKKDK